MISVLSHGALLLTHSTERPCLEQNYYEVLDRDNVEIVDISAKSGNDIVEFTENGIKTKDGKVHELDVIALATGFDITTGGMTNMGLKSIHGTYLQDEWKKSANTYLGTTISGYPNMFHLVSCPHLPTPYLRQLRFHSPHVSLDIRFFQDSCLEWMLAAQTLPTCPCFDPLTDTC